MPGLLDPGRMLVEPHVLGERVALLSIDVESDYGTGRDQALSRIGHFLEVAATLSLPLTAFVEGRLFEQARPLCRELLDSGMDVQLHCYDHAEPGDSPERLRRGFDAYADVCGRPPAGYRAHTYRLSHALYETLVDLGFAWDSSLQRAFGQGSQRHLQLRSGDYLVFDRRMVEFPLGRWHAVPLPFSHAYSLLLRAPGRAVLWALGGSGRLTAYNMHMTDLVRSDSLLHADRSRLSRFLHQTMWRNQGDTTFDALRQVAHRLRDGGYRFSTTQALYETLAPTLGLRRNAGDRQ
jgi:peptidoglycan/xylan/chitin deacetylase (PgdA/CDA1 family)